MYPGRTREVKTPHGENFRRCCPNSCAPASISALCRPAWDTRVAVRQRGTYTPSEPKTQWPRSSHTDRQNFRHAPGRFRSKKGLSAALRRAGIEKRWADEYAEPGEENRSYRMV